MDGWIAETLKTLNKHGIVWILFACLAHTSADMRSERATITPAPDLLKREVAMSNAVWEIYLVTFIRENVVGKE